VLLAGLRALQACCVAAGFVKYAANQELVCELVYGAMATLVGLLGDPTQPPIVRAETALALGCVALGNHGRFWVKIFAGSVATGGGAWPFPVIAAVCDILPTSSKSSSLAQPEIHDVGWVSPSVGGLDLGLSGLTRLNFRSGGHVPFTSVFTFIPSASLSP